MTGELLHTQIDCGIRIWAETDQGIYGYAQPRVTFTYEGEIPTEAHVEWELNKYEFGTDGDEWSLFVARDANDEPIRLLEAVTTYLPKDFPGFFEDMVPRGGRHQPKPPDFVAALRGSEHGMCVGEQTAGGFAKVIHTFSPRHRHRRLLTLPALECSLRRSTDLRRRRDSCGADTHQ